MASTEDPIEISGDEMREILEKYRQTAKNFCDGGSIALWAAMGRLLKVGHLNKDLELGGMQTVTTESNFLACIDKPTNGRDACVYAYIWFSHHYNNLTPVFKFVEDFQKSRDISSFKEMCRQYKEWATSVEEKLDNFRKVQRLIAEVYARYITTRGSSYDQVIDALAAVRQEVGSVEVTLSYISSLLLEVNAQLDRVYVDYKPYPNVFLISDNISHIKDIPKQLLVKFYIHSTLIDAIAAFQSAAYNDVDIITKYDKLWPSTSPNFEERYLSFESQCQSATEAIKALIDNGEKQLQSKLCDGIRILKEK